MTSIIYSFCLSLSVCLSVSLPSSLCPSLPPSLRLNGYFLGESGLTGTRMFPFWILLILETCLLRHAKLQSSSPSTNQRSVFLQAGCPPSCPSNSVTALLYLRSCFIASLVRQQVHEMLTKTVFCLTLNKQKKTD